MRFRAYVKHNSKFLNKQENIHYLLDLCTNYLGHNSSHCYHGNRDHCITHGKWHPKLVCIVGVSRDFALILLKLKK